MDILRQVAHSLEKLQQGDYTVRIDVEGQEGPLRKVVEKVNQLSSQLGQKQDSPKDDPRVGELLELIMSIVAFQYQRKEPSEKRDDLIDVLFESVNLIGEEVMSVSMTKTFLDGVLQAMEDGLLVTESDGSIALANAGLCKILGYESRRHFAGRSLFDLFPGGNELTSLFIQYQKQFQNSSEYDFAVSAIGAPAGVFHQRTELTIQTQSGKELPLDCGFSLLRDPDTGREKYVWLLRDITERRKSERELKRHQENLEQLVEARTVELVQAKEAATSANRAKSQFLASMSHELRTPLNAIIGYAEMVIEELNDLQTDNAPQLRGDLKKIHRSGQHLLTLINEVLDLSKVEAGKMDVSDDLFGVSALLEEVLDTTRTLAKKNDNTVVVQNRLGVGASFSTDRQKLKQIMLNLLSNACKFTNNGQITLAIQWKDDVPEKILFFEVKDTGIGMTSEQTEQVFGSFIQADSSVMRKYGGTGLGLTLCKQFCKLLGGELSVKSQLGVGTTFSCVIPSLEE